MTIPITNKYGWFNIHSSNYDTPVPYTATGSNWLNLLNDGLGPITNTSHKPTSITSVFNTTTSQLDFTELDPGDSFEIRVDLELALSTNNQEVDLRGEFALGSGSPYSVNFHHAGYKTVGVRNIMVYVGGPISSESTRINPGEIQLWSDADLTYKYRMLYLNIRRK